MFVCVCVAVCVCESLLDLGVVHEHPRDLQVLEEKADFTTVVAVVESRVHVQDPAVVQRDTRHVHCAASFQVDWDQSHASLASAVGEFRVGGWTRCVIGNADRGAGDGPLQLAHVL